MTEEFSTMVLGLLKQIDAEVKSLLVDLTEINERLDRIENAQIDITSNFAKLSAQQAAQAEQLDRLEERVIRIERHLDLRETL